MPEVLPFQAVLCPAPASGFAPLTYSCQEALSPFSAREDPPPITQEIADRFLRLDEAPGVYIYRQEFRAEGGLEKTRTSLLAALEIGGQDAWKVPVAQDTEPFGVDRAVAVLGGTGLQEVPLVAVIDDLKFDLDKLLERGALIEEGPSIQLDGGPGDRHRLWKVEDTTLIGEISDFFRGRDCIILDGLHTYRGLRRLADSVPGRPPGRPLRLLAAIFNLFDSGVTLGAACLLLDELPEIKVNDLAMRLSPFFELKGFPLDAGVSLPRVITDFREDLRVHSFADRVIGAYFAGQDQLFLLQLREGTDTSKMFLPDVAEPLREFDSVLLRRVILERYLFPRGIEGLAKEYTWSPEEAIASVRSGKFRAAFFLNPPNKRKLLTLALAGMRLPPGSARLDPPLRARLVMKAVE